MHLASAIGIARDSIAITAAAAVAASVGILGLRFPALRVLPIRNVYRLIVAPLLLVLVGLFYLVQACE